MPSEALPPGEIYLADTPVLRGHAGTQPDLLLRWNTMPASAEAIDVVVHLHGFSQQGGDMQLAEKLPRSGLDLSGRTRPTLAILPRGNWIRHTWYDFPALLDGGLDDLADYALGRFSEIYAALSIPSSRSVDPFTQPSPPLGERVEKGWRGAAEPYPELGEGVSRLTLDRLILTAHSGGGMPAVDAIAGARRSPDEVHIFDGLYGRDPSAGDPLQGLEVVDSWLQGRLASEPERPGALRVVYIERQTGRFSREVGRLIEHQLAAAAPQLASTLAPRYRVEPSGVPHAYVAAICGPVLLADPAADLDWSRIV